MKLDFTEQMSWCSPRWQVMVPYNYTVFLDNAKELVAEKKVSMSRIDDAVARILRVKFEMGLFEKPYADKSLQSYLGAPVSTNLCCCKCPKHSMEDQMAFGIHVKVCTITYSTCGQGALTFFGSKAPH